MKLTGKPSDQLIPRIIAESEMDYVNYQDEDYYNPIKSVTHHPTMEAERILKHQVKKLILMGVPEKTQMGLKEILELPLDLYDMTLEAVMEANKEETEKAEELQNQMEEALAKLKENQGNNGPLNPENKKEK